MKLFITALIAYLIGCFSSAYMLGKVFKNIDIRKFGSGNVGSTNALRVMGFKWGIVTFLFDVFKGVVAVYIGKNISADLGGLIAGVFVVVGHNWPVFIGFKGGKGVATTIGVLIILYGKIIIIPILITIIIIAISKYVSLGSISFLSLAPISYAIFEKTFKIEYFLIGLIFAGFGIIRHRENIKRLLQGTENKVKIGGD